MKVIRNYSKKSKVITDHLNDDLNFIFRSDLKDELNKKQILTTNTSSNQLNSSKLTSQRTIKQPLPSQIFIPRPKTEGEQQQCQLFQSSFATQATQREEAFLRQQKQVEQYLERQQKKQIYQTEVMKRMQERTKIRVIASQDKIKDSAKYILDQKRKKQQLITIMLSSYLNSREPQKMLKSQNRSKDQSEQVTEQSFSKMNSDYNSNNQTQNSLGKTNEYAKFMQGNGIYPQRQLQQKNQQFLENSIKNIKAGDYPIQPEISDGQTQHSVYIKSRMKDPFGNNFLVSSIKQIKQKQNQQQSTPPPTNTYRVSINQNQTVGFMNLKTNGKIDDYEDNGGGLMFFNYQSRENMNNESSSKSLQKRPKTAQPKGISHRLNKKANHQMELQRDQNNEDVRPKIKRRARKRSDMKEDTNTLRCHSSFVERIIPKQKSSKTIVRRQLDFYHDHLKNPIDQIKLSNIIQDKDKQNRYRVNNRMKLLKNKQLHIFIEGKHQVEISKEASLAQSRDNSIDIRKESQ
ncbi:UNKNOWN [Stylonychia lemnae]|uniref:Uncharacterized protein n=1 Tax=Stylonychia lemnae TaxID=5949 RepID=A0A078AYW6_STYLE|nr:UNKNOWN [Stylonychia lemnae]|eukprot:CDW87635.1 UNKNOWN [Stylonychia lemnae]